MDGHFVPNITIGAPVVSSLRNNLGPNTFLDCHLMVTHPLKWVGDFAKAGADLFNFHVESENDPVEVIRAAKAAGMKVGITVKPNTPIEPYIELVPQVDMVLVMTVEPGFGGQSFMEDMMPKVSKLRQLFPDLDIQVDGGLSPTTIAAALDAGANVIVAGSAVFKSQDRAEAIRLLKAGN